MEKIYTKRTESTGQARINDSMASYNQQSSVERPAKSGNGFTMGTDSTLNSLQT